MNSTDLLVRTMVFAIGGWIATSDRIVNAPLDARWRRRLIVPLWFAWLAFGLGGPVSTGGLPLSEAFSVAASCTAGLATYFVMSGIRNRSRAQ